MASAPMMVVGGSCRARLVFPLVVLSIPLIVGSRWALIPATIECVALVVRTVFEDRMLRAELRGYAEHARSTRFRLFPPIW